MGPRYENWDVRGYDRECRDEDGAFLGHEVVVAITEPGQWLWEVVIDGDRLTDFRVCSLARQSVDIRRVPTSNLVRVAQLYLERIKENFEDGSSLHWSMLLSDLQPGQPRRRLDGSPTPDEFARAWNEMGPKSLDGRTRREALADAYRVTTHAIDKWATRARDLGLIAKATTGRPRKERMKE